MTNIEKLKALTDKEIRELIATNPVTFKDEVCGFVWNTGHVGSYIPVIVDSNGIDWTKVNISALSTENQSHEH